MPSMRLTKNQYAFLQIFLVFFWTSAGYLSWMHHLTELMPYEEVDFLTLVVGYLFQAAGLGAFALYLHRGPRDGSRALSLGAIGLELLCMIPALLSQRTAAVLLFGFLMNFFCGLLSARYLLRLAEADSGRRGLALGAGYGAATVAGWLLSLPAGGTFLLSPYVLLIYGATALLIAGLSFCAPGPEVSPPSVSEGQAAPLPSGLIPLACAAVMILSLVKNLGFSFPLADVAAGIRLELSRLFYAVGLVIAGLVNDRNRSWGAILCGAALFLPFLLLALAAESVSARILWATAYLFQGLFTVYRILLFSDAADQFGRPALSGLGLLFGRVGDAAGTILLLALGNRTVALVAVTAALFMAAIALLFLLYHRLYMPVPSAPPTAEERFEQFSARYDLSPREREVLRQLIDGRSNGEIAAALFVSESTVKFHIHNLLGKTGCGNRRELSARFAEDQKTSPS